MSAGLHDPCPDFRKGSAMSDDVVESTAPTGNTPEPLTAGNFGTNLINDHALGALVNLLLTMEPGQQLPSERDLTGQLGLSRNTLRDRIARLESMGALQRKERLGTFYTGVQPKQTGDVLVLSMMFHQMTLDSLISVRHALERQAAVEAARVATEDTLYALAASAAAMHTTVDGKELFEADIAFHRALFAASDSPALVFFSQALQPILQGTLQHLSLAQDFETMRVVHDNILLSVTAGDTHGATEAIDAHFAWLEVLRDRERATTGQSTTGRSTTDQPAQDAE